MRNAIRTVIVNLSILLSILTSAHAAASTNPIETYLGKDVAIAAKVFLDELDRCDSPDFDCSNVPKEKVIEELTGVMHNTLLESWGMEPDAFSFQGGIGAAVGKELIGIVKAGAEAAINVRETEKEQREMRRKLQRQADENGYGDILSETLKEIMD